MPEPERRTVQELITRYQFEPSLRDIYVEGPEDKSIVDAMLEEHRISGVSVFEVSSVDIPAAPGEDNGNRTRLVKLATTLLQSCPDGQLRVACVIDSDFDHLSGKQEHSPFLLSTDYANMDMYFFSAAIIDKMNRHCLRGRTLTHEMRQAFMVPTLHFLFRVRYVNSSPRWHLQALPFDSLVSFCRGRFGFDRDRYICGYLNKNSRSAQRSQFEREVQEVAIPPERDPRCFMHGHDSRALLRKMLRFLGHRNLSKDEDVLFSMLRACADYTSLAQEPLFAAIRERFG